jgi:hypothetical protein
MLEVFDCGRAVNEAGCTPAEAMRVHVLVYMSTLVEIKKAQVKHDSTSIDMKKRAQNDGRPTAVRACGAR